MIRLANTDATHLPADVFSTPGLLEGSGIILEDAGEHELKGLTGRRRLFRVAV